VSRPGFMRMTLQHRQKYLVFASQILIVGLWIFFLSTALYKFLVRNEIGNIRFGPVLKLFYELVVLTYVLLTLDRVKLQILGGIALLFFDFLTGQYFLRQAFGSEPVHFIENVLLFFKYVFVFFIFSVVYDLIRYRYFPEKVEKHFRLILWINGFLIFAGLLFGIKWLASYDNEWRFGYNGAFFSINDSSFLYIIALTYLYYRRYYAGIKEPLFWWTLVSALLVGTKTLAGFLGALLLFHAAKHLRKLNMKIVMAVAAAVLLFIYGVFHRFIHEFFADTVKYFNFLYERYGFWYMLTSGRSSFFTEKIIPLLSRWKWPNFLFGGMIMGKYNVEMDFFDLFMMFGLVGMAVYLSMFNELVRMLYLPKKFKIFFLIIVFGLAFVAGHFFTSDFAGFFFVLLILLTRKYAPGYESYPHPRQV